MIKRINNAGLFSEPSLIIFTKGANNSDHDCIFIYIYKYGLKKADNKNISKSYTTLYFELLLTDSTYM